MPKVRDQDVEAAIEGDEDERLIGGIHRTRRTQGGRVEDEEPGNKKKPGHRVAVPEEDLDPAPAVVLPVVSAVNPPENKKEVKEEMAVTTTPQTTAKPKFEICPVCAFFNKIASNTRDGDLVRYLTCKGCNDKFVVYHAEALKKLARGEKLKVKGKIEWVLSLLDIPRFEREVEEARQARLNPDEALIDKRLSVAAEGQSLSQRDLIDLKVAVKQSVAHEKYELVKRLFARLTAAKKLKPELEQKLAEQKLAAETPEPATSIALLVVEAIA